ncbi:MAG: non-canonical purine NTP diphosphatase [Mediterranea sp.]|jgi:XTP/dITP diphosphohydrolase|nr:non-canonical purine NTP diphosphatase [Mediterranea sp.]
MKQKIVFATNNLYKLKEVSQILGDKIEVLSLKDLHCDVDIPETADTLEGNALLKAQYINKNYGLDAFADDTGLEIEALNNEPGIYSARYAGEGKSDQANMLKVLRKLEGVGNRNARFRTVIALIMDCKTHLFEGVIKGTIIGEKRGEAGFGYDPIFVPEGYDKTFAELGNDIKNDISHRAKAVKELSDFLTAKLHCRI